MKPSRNRGRQRRFFGVGRRREVRRSCAPVPPGGCPPDPRASRRAAGITRVSSGRWRRRALGRDLLGGVGGRRLRRASVEPVVLGCSLLGHPGALRTISHEQERYRAGHERPTPPHVVQPGEPRHHRLGDRGQPARQRPRRRHHEARRLHGRRGRLPAQRRAGGDGRDGRDDLPRAGARRRHHQDLCPGQLGGHLVDGDRRPGRGAAVGQRRRRAAARRERLLRVRRHRRGRPLASGAAAGRPRRPPTYDDSARPRSAARTGWPARPRSTRAEKE